MNNINNWHIVVFKLCTGIEKFRYNKRIKVCEKMTQFINTETHEIVALWDNRIIGFEAE
jgi:hypothetical protein